MGTAIHIYFIVLFLVTLHQPVLSLTNCSPLDRPDLSCIVTNRIGFDDCRPDVLEKAFPHLYITKNEYFTPEPYDLWGNLFEKRYGEDYLQLYPGVNLTFQTIMDDRIKYLKGFELMIHEFDPNIAGKAKWLSCVIFDLSNVKWKITDYANLFRYHLFPLHGATLYYIEIYSLPKPPIHLDMYASYKFMTPSFITENNFPKNWVTQINYTASIGSNSKAAVKFNFMPPPTEYGFTEFLVLLVDPTGYPRTVQEDFIKTFNHEFNDVDFGVYEIWVEPQDDFKYLKGKCYCSGQIGRCGTCIVSKTQSFNVSQK